MQARRGWRAGHPYPSPMAGRCWMVAQEGQIAEECGGGQVVLCL